MNVIRARRPPVYWSGRNLAEVLALFPGRVRHERGFLAIRPDPDSPRWVAIPRSLWLVLTEDGRLYALPAHDLAIRITFDSET